MSWLIAAALVSASGVDGKADAVPADEIAQVAVDLPTGSLIFSKGDCLAVRAFTSSCYTHVAIVVEQGGEVSVYDSANGTGVRRQSLVEYLKGETPGEIHIVTPTKPFSKSQKKKFRDYLDEQVGRPYSVTHHLTGKRVEGLHCAEYSIEALMAAAVMKANNPAKVSPGSLFEGVRKKETYSPIRSVTLTEVPLKPADNWCGECWQGTSRYTRRCYLKLRGWFCCY